MQQLAGQTDLLDALAVLDPTPPVPRREGSGAPDGVRPLTDADVRASLAEGLRWAVPIHMAELRDVPAARRRHYLPPGGLEALGMADAIMFKTKNWKGTARAFDAYARTLAILAYEPGGVSIWSSLDLLHFCTAPHPGCPHDWTPREAVNLAAVAAEFHAILDQYEALLDADDRAEQVPAPRRPAPASRRAVRRPRPVETVPTGGVL